MQDSLSVARIAWTVGTITARSTVGGRRAIRQVLRDNPDPVGIGESRLVRDAVDAALDPSRDPSPDAAQPPDDALSAPIPGPNATARLVGLPVRDLAPLLAALPAQGTARGHPAADASQLADELDRLWDSHGRDACEQALRAATRRAHRGAFLKFAVLAFFIGMIIFVAHDLLSSADRLRRNAEEAERYSVPLDAINPAPAPSDAE